MISTSRDEGVLSGLDGGSWMLERLCTFRLFERSLHRRIILQSFHPLIALHFLWAAPFPSLRLGFWPFEVFGRHDAVPD